MYFSWRAVISAQAGLPARSIALHLLFTRDPRIVALPTNLVEKCFVRRCPVAQRRDGFVEYSALFTLKKPPPNPD